ncbi:MAG: 4'-phosphopantetheinyl transferase superfamily protein [Nitrospirales bacterium]
MNVVTNWQSSNLSPQFSLGHSHVEIWRTTLAPEGLSSAAFRALLSPDEIVRADQFKSASAQQQFVVTRCMLRHLLGRYTGMPPHTIQLRKTVQGKPFPVFPKPLALQCNVSHTQGLAVVAISGGVPVGIDVETVDRTIHAEELARRFFSEREADRLSAMTEDQRIIGFLTYWTCKEAYLKMQGLGLSADLSKYEIEFDPGGQTAWIAGISPWNSPTPYFLGRINPGADFLGAIAVATPSPEISYFDWNPDVLTNH